MNNLNNTKTEKEKSNGVKSAGFTLFVAMIVSSLLLAVGFSIGNIILKQLLLAGSGKESQAAFYAADSGSECVQFWDTKNADGNPASESPFLTTIPKVKINCGNNVATSSTSNSASSTTSTVVIDFSSTAENYKACALVVIEKGFTSTSTSNGNEDVPFTKITSRGYNSSYVPAVGNTPAGCDTSSQRTVERGLYIQY